MDNQLQAEFKTVIQGTMDELSERVFSKDFSEEVYALKNRVNTVLVPDVIFKSWQLEKMFTVSLEGIWKKLAVVAANAGLGEAVTNYRIYGTIKTGRLRRITETVNRLAYTGPEAMRTRPDWNAELAYIMKGRGRDFPVSIVCDVFCEDKLNAKKYVFELESPFLNSNKTKVSKEKLLKLHSMSPLQVDEVYFALPYNPYGRKENYTWGFPTRWFNMTQDEVVLIGEEFWDKIGGVGTYTAFIEAVNEIGSHYKERIYREFLGIEPPLR
jgi:hypothetical protein